MPGHLRFSIERLQLTQAGLLLRGFAFGAACLAAYFIDPGASEAEIAVFIFSGFAVSILELIIFSFFIPKPEWLGQRSPMPAGQPRGPAWRWLIWHPRLFLLIPTVTLAFAALFRESLLFFAGGALGGLVGNARKLAQLRRFEASEGIDIFSSWSPSRAPRTIYYERPKARHGS